MIKEQRWKLKFPLYPHYLIHVVYVVKRFISVYAFENIANDANKNVSSVWSSYVNMKLTSRRNMKGE